MTFGDHTVTPGAGVSRYSGGVDLRPEQNLIVVFDAGLDADTGLAQWRLTSVDPETLQFPEDPLAGFLPPNVTQPEGEGSVTFTVEQKAALVSGTEICNEASIVFDVNEPIATPPWCNTIDEDAPTSAVAPLATAQPGPLFEVEWSGTDVHAGVAGYTVYVSEGDGPFEPWLEDTTRTQAVFAGKAGETYAFYSVATDRVGNVEAVPTEADSSTIVRAGCGQPVTTGQTPSASDCLFVLRAAVGLATCDPACICDVNADGSRTAVDALICLKKAVGQDVTLACACTSVTTTTTPTTTFLLP
jgi:hypothetical protein